MDLKRDILFLAKDGVVVQYNKTRETCNVFCEKHSYVADLQALAPRNLDVFKTYLEQAKEGVQLGCSLDKDADKDVILIYECYEGLRLNKISIPLKPSAVVNHWDTLQLAIDVGQQNWILAQQYKAQNEHHKQLAQDLVEAKIEHDRNLYAKVATVFCAREDEPSAEAESPHDSDIKLE